MNKVLLIWDGGDCAPVYYVFDHGTEMADLAIASAGHYINGDDLPDDHAIYTLNEKLTEHESSWCDKPIKGDFVTVVVCGFLP